MENDHLPNVVIIGSGFGGMTAAQALAKSPVQVTLLDRHNYHLFQPLLYQVATAGVSPDEIAYPVHAIFRRQKNLDFRLAKVDTIDAANQRLLTSAGELHYDVLILAPGGVTNFFGLDTIEKQAFKLKDLDDAEIIRNHILKQVELAVQEPDPELRKARLTFVITGGGPTGVETAGALSELVRMVLHKDYNRLDSSEIKILLLEAADRLIPAFSTRLSAKTADALAKKGVEVRFQCPVTSFDGNRVTLKSGETIDTRTLIWAAGVRASPLAQQIAASPGPQGKIKVLPTLQVPEHPEIFVIGDAAYLVDEHGEALPMLAPVAIQQGKAAARNAVHFLEHAPLQPFVYKDPGTLATIGRNQAVANLWGLQLSGFLAWLVWGAVHIFSLIGFRNRILVMIEWIWDYLFYSRAVLIIYNQDNAQKVEPVESKNVTMHP
jgi:NADH dehydrogenase